VCYFGYHTYNVELRNLYKPSAIVRMVRKYELIIDCACIQTVGWGNLSENGHLEERGGDGYWENRL
jgi:hypothetical protein